VFGDSLDFLHALHFSGIEAPASVVQTLSGRFVVYDGLLRTLTLADRAGKPERQAARLENFPIGRQDA